jgi:hypothetical protein
MAQKKKSSLTDPDNDPVFVEVPGTDVQETEGMSVEDAYRHLADMPPEPVIEPEEN